jgi:hypothetical protein
MVSRLFVRSLGLFLLLLTAEQLKETGFDLSVPVKFEP